MTYSTKNFGPPVRYRGDGFSLVEMLLVMAVMSILLVLSYSSFSVFRSTLLASSGNQVADFATMARQNSIAKNAYTAIVIKTSGTSACSAYCLLQLVRNDDGSFGQWKALTPWKYLPGATIFEIGASKDTFMAGGNLQVPPFPSMAGALVFQGAPWTGSTSYQIYQPDGTLMGGQAVRLRLVQGTADASVPAVTTSVGPNYYDLVFVANSGTVEIERP